MSDTTIGAVCKRFSSGKGIKASEIKPTGKYPVIGANGFRGYTDKYNFDGRCAIIGRQGAFCGNVHYFDGKAYMTEHAIVAEANDNNDSGYLAFLFKEMDLSQFQGQSAQPGLSVNTLSKVPIHVPNLLIQKKIFEVLHDIDRKIKMNNAISSKLESLARMIYHYWFLQFDFPDKNGRPYRSSGGKMVWNAELKREIPDGWKVTTLGKIFDITMGSSPKGDSLNENQEGMEFYQGSTDFGNLFPKKRVYTTSPIRLAKAQDVLLSVRAPVGDMNFAINDCCIGRGLAAIHCKSPLFAFNTLKTFQGYFDVFNNNGTTFGALTSDGLKEQTTIDAPNNLVQQYENIVKSMEAELRNTELENRRLTSLRDFLLPLLMNGQVIFK